VVFCQACVNLTSYSSLRLLVHRREDHIQKKVDAMVAEAKKKLGAKDKKGALFAMKRKKMYESEIEKIMGSKMTLETQIMSLEASVQNMETFRAMKAGKDAMANVRKNVDVDNVDEMMDDIREEMETANEISEAIGRPVDGDMYDEDELLGELNMLEEEGETNGGSDGKRSGCRSKRAPTQVTDPYPLLPSPSPSTLQTSRPRCSNPWWLPRNPSSTCQMRQRAVSSQRRQRTKTRRRSGSWRRAWPCKGLRGGWKARGGGEGRMDG